ncbi:hypothetical protein [Sinorhizobium meliloti]|uniref:hypothetical protein n=1 Tax=Rhizobium meliloti TaxID=382 RepID=UPI001F19399A|nr:hypothetical protein [Sinorhizobium meliloti]
MAQTKTPLTAEDTIRAWAAAVAARDIEAVMAFYADPLLVFDMVGPLQREGKALYRRAWVDEFFPWHGGTGKFAVASLPFIRATTSPLAPASWTAAAPKAVDPSNIA